MSLIKYPTFIKPARVTMRLVRTDEIFASPITNIQQVVSRGNAAWTSIIEYTDLSDNERDIVEAFLTRCKGPTNTFKIPDFADYGAVGDVADWADVFSTYGEFNVDAGSGTNDVNSWWHYFGDYEHHITDEDTLRFDAMTNISTATLLWRGTVSSYGVIDAWEAGRAYVARLRHFNRSDKDAHTFQVAVGSGRQSGGRVQLLSESINSTGQVSFPFFTGVQTADISVIEGSGVSHGDYWEYADFRSNRCALVANSENQILYSNWFDDATWVGSHTTIESGFAGDPQGGANLWRMYVNSSEVNSNHFIQQTITVTNTRDTWTGSIKVRAPTDGLAGVRLSLKDSAGNESWAIANVKSATIVSAVASGDFVKVWAEAWPVQSDFVRCQITAVVTSLTDLIFHISATNSDNAISYATADTSYLEISAAQLVKFPFMKHYCETTSSASAVNVTSGQTGSTLLLEGFDAKDIVKAGQRFEIVTQFHTEANSLYEKSEFKRVTREAKATLDGRMAIEFDPPIRNAPATGASVNGGDHYAGTLHNPVIFYKPEMKARLIDNTIQYIEKPLKLTDITFEVVEDLT